MSPHSVFELLRIVEIQRVTSRVYMGLGPIIPLFWPASGAMGAARGSWRFAPGVVAPPRELHAWHAGGAPAVRETLAGERELELRSGSGMRGMREALLKPRE
jgi:hypothetical protein